MNAIELLKSDHAVVERLFQEAEAEPGSPKVLKLFDVIKFELETHAHLEETIFYPAIQEEGNEELLELTSEALKEHMDTKTMLGELSVTDEDSFDAMFVKLIEDVRHHVREEEGEMFPLVEAQFGSEGLDELGTQMQSEKERFQASTESIHN
jgi:iron-sulfur cluster repair protein YtfE (RIC family)